MMTAQIPDKILYKGKNTLCFQIHYGPIYRLWILTILTGTSTGNYRGYIASWEVIDNKLFLTSYKIPGFLPEMDREGNLFPEKEKTFAHWYTGRLRMPHGELLEYVHQGYASIYEKELYLRFLNGNLIGEGEKDNRPEYEEKIAREKRYEKEREDRKLKNRLWNLFKKKN